MWFMRRVLPYVVLFVLSLLLIQPALSNVQICADDLQAHLHKAYALELSWANGVFIPRWIPDMARGYGYPMYNFYAPLSSYPLLGLHLLGVAYPAAIILIFLIYIYLTGVGAFLFARDLFDESISLCVAMLYMSAPYLGFDVMYRGALAEVSGWLWLPLALWAVRRAMLNASWRWTVIAALCYAALIPSHNLLALISTPLLMGWVGVQILENKNWRLGLYGSSALALGLLLAAYFWLPVLVERAYVRTDRLLDSSVLQYFNNFLAPNELYTQWQFDPLLINPAPSRGLGLIATVLAVAGAVTLFTRFRWSHLYFLLVTVGYCFLTLEISRPIWDVTPLMPFFQFPWRLLTPAALGAALLGGYALTALRAKVGNTLTLFVSGLVLFFNLAWWSPTCCTPTSTTPAEFRAETFMEGAHSYSEYLPMWVKLFPQDENLFNALVNGEAPDRLAIPNAQVVSHSKNVLNARYTVSITQDTVATYKQFYYPGWTVEVNGHAVDILPRDDSGVIRFNLPRGTHELKIYFAETPLRLAADSISVGALLISLIVFALSPQIKLPPTESALARFWLMAFVLTLLFALFKIGILDRAQASAFNGEQVANAQPLRASFVGGVELYGYNLERTVRSGDWFDVTLYAGVREKIPGAFVPTFVVEDAQGFVWSDLNVSFPRWLRPPYAANLWEPNKYALWARRVTLLTGTPPGTYKLYGALFDVNDPSHAPISLLDENGNARSPRFELGTIMVLPPTRVVTLASLGFPNPAPQTLTPALSLWHATADRAEATAGDTVLLNLFFKAEQPVAASPKLVIELNDTSGQTLFTQNETLAVLQGGEVRRVQIRVRLPAELKSGGYRWGIKVNDGASRAFGELRVTAPVRAFVAPSFNQKVGLLFSDFAELSGYTLRADKINLVWRALKNPSTSYAVFVHVVRGERIWAQSDGVPARLTTSWLPNEFVADERTLTFPLDAPSGEYEIFVGWVDVLTNRRVTDRIKIGVLLK